MEAETFGTKFVSSANQHLVVVDLYHEGHHCSYIEMVVDGWLDKNPFSRVSIMVTRRFMTVHAEYLKRIEEGVWGERITIVPLLMNQPQLSATGICRFLAINWAHRKALKQAIGLKPNHVLCMYLDHAQGAIVGLSSELSSLNIGISGILFRVSHHRSNSTFRERLVRVRKRILLKRLLRLPTLHAVFCLDPGAVYALNTLSPSPKAHFLPDGTLIHPASVPRNTLRAAWGASEADHVALQFGAQSARKGIFQVLEAFTRLKKDTWILVVAGKATEADEKKIQVAIEAAQTKAKVVWDSTFLAEGDVTAHFEACDVVFAAYPNHVGSSGILIRAAAAGKPVVGSAMGLVGDLIRQYNLGYAVDCREPKEIVQGLLQVFDDARFDSEKAAEFAEKNTPSEFTRLLCEGIGGTDSRNIAGDISLDVAKSLTSIKKLCVQWPRFGPYHLARLKEVHVWCKKLGIELIGLETASKSDLYEWRVENAETAFKRIQVFKGKTWESLTPHDMHDGVVRALVALQPDVLAIHTYSLPDSRACLLWAKQNGKASIVMTDSKADDAVRYRWKEWLKGILIREYDAAFLAGEPQKAYFELLGYPSNAIALGYNTVDNAFFATPSPLIDPETLPGLNDETPYMMASNRFLERKNLDNLILAYGEYRKSTLAPYRLLMLGDGLLRPRLEKLVAENGIEGVEFVGFRQIEELPTYYLKAAFFVHPSRVDTWALVVNEAMAAGLPVIVCTGAGSHQDLVRPGENGFLFDADDIGALANHMKVLTENEKLRQAAGLASLEIIAEWNLDRFASGLFEATATATKRKGRTMCLVSRVLINVLKKSSSATLGHSVES